MYKNSHEVRRNDFPYTSHTFAQSSEATLQFDIFPALPVKFELRKANNHTATGCSPMHESNSQDKTLKLATLNVGDTVQFSSE